MSSSISPEEFSNTPRDQSPSGILPTPPNNGVSLGEVMSNPMYNRANTIKTGDHSYKQAFTLHRKVARGIYSISLAFLILLLLAFVAVTPIDVIVKTSSASYSGLKLFIVIIVCVVFLVTSFFLYFLRVYQHRVSLNDIPSKSVYIPFEGDLPRSVFHFIDDKITLCTRISSKISPLQNLNVTINHPGLSPPDYVQRRNQDGDDGTLLPPNILYEDIVRSFSDRFNRHNRYVPVLNVPYHYSFREIIIYTMQDLVDQNLIQPHDLPDLATFFSVYEKLRFGPHLIQERDMLTFILECDHITSIFINFYGGVFSTRKKRRNAEKLNESSILFGAGSSTSYTNSRSDFDSYMLGSSGASASISASASSSSGSSSSHSASSSDLEDIDKDKNDNSNNLKPKPVVDNNIDSLSQRNPSTMSLGSNQSVLMRKPSISSTNSVIKRKLSLTGSSKRQSNDMDKPESIKRDSLRKTSALLQRLNEDFNKFNAIGGDNQHKDNDDASDSSIYNFRPRQSLDKSSKVLDLKIQRLRSPKKKFVEPTIFKNSRLSSPTH